MPCTRVRRRRLGERGRSSSQGEPTRITRESLEVVGVIALGGVLGTLLRYEASVIWPNPAGTFPTTILLVNLLGCLVIGAFLTLITERRTAHRLVRPFFGTGRRTRHGRHPPSDSQEAVMNNSRIDAPVTALRLTIFIGDSDMWHHKPLSAEIVHRAHQQGLAGASVFHGSEGFGASSVVHPSRLLSVSEDLPLAIIIIDHPDRINAFLPQLDELIGEGLVILDEVTVIKYVGRASSGRR